MSEYALWEWAPAVGLSRSSSWHEIVSSTVGYFPLVVGTEQLWHSRDPALWEEALAHYWDLVQPRNLELERRMESLDAEDVRHLDAEGWYDWLLNVYFRWKYTAPNRYATTTAHLRWYAEAGELAALARIQDRLFEFDRGDIREGLSIAREIRGLGPPGVSGLLAVLFPAWFGTADSFVGRALWQVTGLPEAAAVARMNPDRLTYPQAAVLIEIMRRQAAENNDAFGTSSWTPRMIDKALWAWGR
jgi:hypothetical protein